MKLAWGTLVAASTILAIGCEGNISTAPPTPAMSASAPAPPTPEPPADKTAADEDAAAAADDTASAAAPTDQPPAAEPETAPTSPPGEPAADAPPAASTEPAEAGNTEVATAASGAKGRDYGGPGFVTTPIQQYFRAEGRINLLHMANALKIYKAGHDNKGPKTHDEFMNVIVKENGVELPELPPGDEYLYDPKTEQLLVKHPAKSDAKQPPKSGA